MLHILPNHRCLATPTRWSVLVIVVSLLGSTERRHEVSAADGPDRLFVTPPIGIQPRQPEAKSHSGRERESTADREFGLALLNPEGSQRELESAGPNLDRLWMGVAATIAVAAGAGLLFLMKRLGVVPSAHGDGRLALQATLQLRPGVTLHLVGTDAAELLVAADQRGIQSVTTLHARFEWDEPDIIDNTNSVDSESTSPHSRSVATTTAGRLSTRDFPPLASVDRPVSHPHVSR
ncbi:MAG: hypothetical protein KDA75_05060 [Planctomycetaceae bacterium]|nr:hypothetical protein [Planctomycetaceae bacterium]